MKLLQKNGLYNSKNFSFEENELFKKLLISIYYSRSTILEIKENEHKFNKYMNTGIIYFDVKNIKNLEINNGFIYFLNYIKNINNINLHNDNIKVIYNNMVDSKYYIYIDDIKCYTIYI